MHCPDLAPSLTIKILFHVLIDCEYCILAPAGVSSPRSNLGFCSITNQTSTPEVCEAEERKMSTILREEMLASLAMAAWMESWAAVRENCINWL